MNIESEFVSCTSQAAGQMCGQAKGPTDSGPGTNTGPAALLKRSR
jgi:hypothetical protein